MVITAITVSQGTSDHSVVFSIKCVVVGNDGSIAEMPNGILRGRSSIVFSHVIHCPFQRLSIVSSKENDVDNGHVAKQNFEEPCAVMSARTELWEHWVSNRPVPPDQHPRPTGSEFAKHHVGGGYFIDRLGREQ